MFNVHALKCHKKMANLIYDYEIEMNKKMSNHFIFTLVFS